MSSFFMLLTKWKYLPQELLSYWSYNIYEREENNV